MNIFLDLFIFFIPFLVIIFISGGLLYYFVLKGLMKKRMEKLEKMEPIERQLFFIHEAIVSATIILGIVMSFK